jgi:hypothetical protein
MDFKWQLGLFILIIIAMFFVERKNGSSLYWMGNPTNNRLIVTPEIKSFLKTGIKGEGLKTDLGPAC